MFWFRFHTKDLVGFGKEGWFSGRFTIAIAVSVDQITQETPWWGRLGLDMIRMRYVMWILSTHTYHIISYHILSYHIISYHIISYHIISYHIFSYHILSYHIISYHIISYHIISCHINSYHIPSFHIISYHIISYHIISYHIISYHILPYQFISYPILSYHIISYHIISYHIISYHIILNHIKSHHIHVCRFQMTAPKSPKTAPFRLWWAGEGRTFALHRAKERWGDWKKNVVAFCWLFFQTTIYRVGIDPILIFGFFMILLWILDPTLRKYTLQVDVSHRRPGMFGQGSQCLETNPMTRPSFFSMWQKTFEHQLKPSTRNYIILHKNKSKRWYIKCNIRIIVYCQMMLYMSTVLRLHLKAAAWAQFLEQRLGPPFFCGEQVKNERLPSIEQKKGGVTEKKCRFFVFSFFQTTIYRVGIDPILIFGFCMILLWILDPTLRKYTLQVDVSHRRPGMFGQGSQCLETNPMTRPSFFSMWQKDIRKPLETINMKLHHTTSK